MSLDLTVSDRTKTVRYKKMFGTILISWVGAHSIVLFGVKITFLEAILSQEYYMAMAGSFPIALLLTTYVSYVSRKLDRRWCWIKQSLHRALAQAIFGVLLTGFAAFILAFVYFRIRGVDILDTHYLRLDFPVVLLLIFVLNTLVIFRFFYTRLKYTILPSKQLKDTVEISSNPKTPGIVKQTIPVQQAGKAIAVPVSDICYITLEGHQRYISTFSGHKYHITFSMDQLEKLLDPNQFFRASRQTIINIGACTHYSAIEFNKLEVFTIPPLQERLTISQGRTRAFKDWMDR